MRVPVFGCFSAFYIVGFSDFSQSSGYEVASHCLSLKTNMFLLDICRSSFLECLFNILPIFFYFWEGHFYILLCVLLLVVGERFYMYKIWRSIDGSDIHIYIRKLWCKCILPVCGLPFMFLKMSQGRGEGSFFCTCLESFQYDLLKRLSFPHWIALARLLKISCPYRCWSVSKEPEECLPRPHVART